MKKLKLSFLVKRILFIVFCIISINLINTKSNALTWVVTVGYVGNNPSFVFIKDDKPVGLFIDIMENIADKNNITLTGNFYDMLSQVAMLSNDVYYTPQIAAIFGTPAVSVYGSPDILIKNMLISGKL